MSGEKKSIWGTLLAGLGLGCLVLVAIGIGVVYWLSQQDFAGMLMKAGTMAGEIAVEAQLDESSIEQERKDALMKEVRLYTADLNAEGVDDAEMTAMSEEIIDGFLDVIMLFLPLEETVLQKRAAGAERDADMRQVHRLWYGSTQDHFTAEQEQRIWEAMYPDSTRTNQNDQRPLHEQLSEADYVALITEITAICDEAEIPTEVPAIDYAAHFRACREAAAQRTAELRGETPASTDTTVVEPQVTPVDPADEGADASQ